MAKVSPETVPAWAILRAGPYKAKLMDQNPLVPFGELAPDIQRRQHGRWLAYAWTLDNPRRTYIYNRVVETVEMHARERKSYTLADLGAGNGRNTIKTAMMLHKRTSPGTNHLYLVEQSGAAIDAACRFFQENGFTALSTDGSQSLTYSTDDLRSTIINFRQEDITNTTLPPMDAVTIVNVWHHLPTWEKLMASAGEIDRILKPGGLFVIVDTRALPPSGLMRHIIEGKIRGALKLELFLARAQAEGIQVGENEIAGIRDFCEHDGFKAFENALTKSQFTETLQRSALAPSLQKITDLRSPHPFLRLIYPSLNFAWGIKG